MVLFKILCSLGPSIRRRYLYYFNRSYVKDKLSKRRSCNSCPGICCIRTRKCLFLRKGKCLLYKIGRPLFCKIFPIDEKDIELSGVSDVCKFYWGDKK